MPRNEPDHAMVGDILEERAGYWRTVPIGSDPLGLSTEQRAASDRAQSMVSALGLRGPLTRWQQALLDLASEVSDA